MKYTENECSCEKCKSMCKTPCVGTPDDMMKLINAGYSERLSRTGWAAGIMLGTHHKIIDIIAPLKDLEKGRCTFQTDEGLCELHDMGLKPTEGRFASCRDKKFEDKNQLFETPLYKCIAEWEKLNLKS